MTIRATSYSAAALSLALGAVMTGPALAANVRSAVPLSSTLEAPISISQPIRITEAQRAELVPPGQTAPLRHNPAHYIKVRGYTTPMPVVSVVHSFADAEGASPIGALIQGVSGALYGETSALGSSGGGSIFKVTPSGTFGVLHQFAGTPDGANPSGGLRNIYGDIAIAGNVYGVSQAGGANGLGAVFATNPAGKTTILHSFSGPDGSAPSGRLLLFVDGNYYGTTSAGGAYGGGTVYRISPKGAFRTLYNFTGLNDGYNSLGGLSLLINGFCLDNNLYGTTSQGGTSGNGTLFKISPSTGKLTTLYSFTNNLDGATPVAEMVPDFNGNLYGTAAVGGSSQSGVVFELSSTKHAFSVIHDFAAGPSGAIGGTYQQNPLSLDIAGNLFGVSNQFGGTDPILDPGSGVLYEISPSLAFTVVHIFEGPEGANPAGPVTVGIDGNLYGTASNGGANFDGTVYSLPHP